MTRPILLDLFCGAGGAAMGYHRAGFDVVGVDIKPQPHYPFEFIQADALTFPLDGFDAIHASPPCQPFTRGQALRRGKASEKPDLVAATRDRLKGGVPWVIENVPGAPLRFPATLCGSMFGLAVRRHRLFESSELIWPLRPCQHREQGRPVGVYHTMNDQVKGIDHSTGKTVYGGRTAATVEEGGAAMGIDWMTWDEMREAIPPAFTEWVGGLFIDALGGGRSAGKALPPRAALVQGRAATLTLRS
jgi:DNA (cytosine-5)-methyltransferase 1